MYELVNSTHLTTVWNHRVTDKIHQKIKNSKRIE